MFRSSTQTAGNKDEKRLYKFFVSIAFGLLGFLVNFYPLNVLIPPNKASFVWGLVFPMLISVSWGWRYGLVSLLLGLGGQTMWFLWVPINGWAPFVAIPLYNLWILWHGWCAQRKGSRFFANFYRAEIPFRIVGTVIHLTLFPWIFQFNPSPWAPLMTMTTAPPPFVNFVVIKQIIEGLMILLLADVLLSVGPIRKILLLEQKRKAQSGVILSGALLFGLIFWIISGVTDFFFYSEKLKFLLAHPSPSLADSLVLQIPPDVIFTRVVFIFLCLVAGLLVSKFFQRAKASEAALLKSEEQYRELVETINDWVWEVNSDGVYTFCSSKSTEILGYAPQEVLGKTPFDFMPPAEADRLKTSFSQIVQRKQAIKALENVNIHKDGRKIILETNGLPFFDQNGTLLGYRGIDRDITERKGAQEELQASEERYREIFDAPTDAIFIHDADTGGIVDVNRAMLDMYGYSHDEALRITMADVSAGEPPCTGVEAGSKVYNAIHYGPQVFEWHARKKNGELFWVEVSLRYTEFSNKGYVIAVARDVNDRKMAVQELAAEKERLAVTLRSIGDGVITTDVSGNIVLINKVAEELCGWTYEEARGKPLDEVFRIFSNENRVALENPARKVMATGNSIHLSEQTILISKNGKEKRIADSGAPIRDAQSRIVGVVLVFRDVTEKTRMEMERLKIKKLESVGVLAGGIAHDFNNILVAILGNISLASQLIEPAHKAYPLLAQAEKASLRAKELTQQLLTFSKGGEPVKESASLPEIIKDSAEFVLHGGNVFCAYQIPDDLWFAEVDKGQISQVIQNIILNAKHAMPGGGVIQISCANIDSIAAERVFLPEKNKYVRLVITDSGIGIPESVIDKIFDPYFSTKKEGSGLGLAITHSIISKHNGNISVTSTPGKGTTFTIYLPASPQAQARQLQGEEVPAKGKYRIMIMDDEELVRHVATGMLSHLGHETVAARDGEEAIYFFKKNLESGTPVDLIIMDLTIPGGMGGKDAVQAILAINPEARVIVSSGYSTDPIMANFRDYGFCGAMVKPYQLHELSAAINQAFG